jgi:hypothetical protein
MMVDDKWIGTMRSPRPVSIGAWFRCARRGDVWWPGKTFTVDFSNEHEPEPGEAFDSWRGLGPVPDDIEPIDPDWRPIDPGGPRHA